MHLAGTLSSIILALFTISSSNSQRITTIQLDGVQYFISRMNPYSPELNFFLAYQYCRSLGLQLVSFETKEKAESITQYLINAGYQKFDFWTSGNKLGTQMLLWMNTGSQFNATFNNMKKVENDTATFELPTGNTSPQRTARENGDNDLTNSCVAMKAPSLEWDVDDCTSIKDFICEQTRCYYYNYGSIPVSSAQGKVSTTTTQSPYTSSSSISAQTQKHVPMGINELVSNLRSTASPKPEDLEPSTTTSLKNQDEEVELGTNGPYDNFHSNVEMNDDPSALVDYHVAEENYASTVEPDTVTTYERSSRYSL